ncbi:MAG TPA: HpcH/HpaI aldolase/citrate lyase family protein [Thermoanaerobaculia bacterium]|nr:HpcH/HpaI aldolase/citrate lyase family protein [Thermoanaerobaculia bacterium]
MKLPVNRFKAALRRPAVQAGLWLSLGTPVTAEIAATAGFDWLLADGEHGPNDALTIAEQLRAAAPYPVSFVARVRDGSGASIGPLLDAGVQSIMVPKVEDARQAEALVRQLRYPPAGERGVAIGSVRASRWGAIADYMGEASGQLCLIIQVETSKGLDNLPQLAAVDGVDGIFIGPNDLAAALGHPGEPSHPDVEGAIADALAMLASAGTPAGILVRNIEDGARYAALGCRFIAVGSDAGTLAHGLRELARDARIQMAQG